MQPTLAEPAWYCIRTAPRLERKVSLLLEREVAIESFAPKFRFRRSRAGQAVWATEAMFPGYVLARFEYHPSHRQIRALPGVTTIVQFGDKPAKVDDNIVDRLRVLFAGSETVVVSPALKPGSEVAIISGPLRGLQLLVTRVIPARQRIAVLLEILGGPREIELGAEHVLNATRDLSFAMKSSEGAAGKRVCEGAASHQTFSPLNR